MQDVGETPAAILAADVDFDGFLDLLTADRSSETVSFLEGKGDGTFEDAIPSNVEDKPDSLAIGQFNDDNRDGRVDSSDFLDLVSANRAADTASLLFGRGDGTFVRDKNKPSSVKGVGDNPNSVVMGQFNDDNGDGRRDSSDLLDVALANKGS